MLKNLVIIPARGIGDLIYHLPLLRSLYESYNKKLTIISNKVNHSKEVYKFESFHEKIIEFDNTRFSFLKTLKTIKEFKNLINETKADRVILTANSRRLMLPVYLSNIKKKIIFGGGKFLLNKDIKYNYLNHANKIFKYTNDLNLPIKNESFFLSNSQINKNNENANEFKIFISLDSHHDQNNWPIENYIEIISKLLSIDNIKIFINFSPNKLSFLNLFPKKIINLDNVKFTHTKNILDIIKIINSCNVMIGNESGPVCLGASLKKEVHSIYLPIHTEPESQIINKEIFYYNADKENSRSIINKIINSVLRKIS